jgi:hypothetical protein
MVYYFKAKVDWVGGGLFEGFNRLFAKINQSWKTDRLLGQNRTYYKLLFL